MKKTVFMDQNIGPCVDKNLFRMKNTCHEGQWMCRHHCTNHPFLKENKLMSTYYDKIHKSSDDENTQYLCIQTATF